MKTDNTQAISDTLNKLAEEMKERGWVYSDDMYADAIAFILDEMADTDEDHISKAMLGANFASTLQSVWEDYAEQVCSRTDQFMILSGDTRKFFIMRAPRNDNRFTSVLVAPDHTIVAALHDEGVKAFHEHNRNLNRKHSRKVEVNVGE